MRKFSRWLAGLALIAAIQACSPLSANQVPEAVMTGVALTIQAQLSPTVAVPAATLTPAGFPTLPPATDTAPAAATDTAPASAAPSCDIAQFITDVTVPDNTVMTQNQSFTKTWRLKNVGTCSWTSSYALIFFSGDSMNGPAVQALSGNVNQGQTVDISVDLKAPGSDGTYTGYWKLRNASGVAFTQFYVQIKVQGGGGGGGGTHTVTLTTVGGEDGQVRSDGTVLSPPNTGDTDTNTIAEAFLSFDISGIPSNATITKTITDFSDYDTLGNPFSLGNDGCVRAYVQDYGSLNAGDFFAGDPLGAVARWCSTGELDNTSLEQPDMVAALQGELGSSRFQLRVQFRPPTTNNNGIADMIRFGNVNLRITYTTP